jgi:hypothetical protein
VRNGAAALMRSRMLLRMMTRLLPSMDEVVKNLMVPNWAEKASRLSSGEMAMPPLPWYAAYTSPLGPG